ncbi:MAG: hypothetical protein ACI4XS_02785 [Bacillus sp. (in: firmicutes)]
MNVTKIDDLKLHHQSLELIDDVPENKYLHLMIVLANMANATNELQNDENHASISREALLSQYRSGLQSILILGEESGFEADWVEDYPHLKVNGELSNHLMQILEAVVLLRVKKSTVIYKALLTQYLQVGKMLSFELADIIDDSI